MRPSGDPGPVVVRVDAGRRNNARKVAVVLVAFVAIAIVKPWPAAVRQAVQQPSAVATPSAGPDLAGAGPTAGPTEVSRLCNDSSGWRIATIEELIVGLPFSVWGLVDPVEAKNERDPRIPIHVVTSGSVTALGYCAPVDPAPPADLEVSIIRLEPGRPPDVLRVVRLGPNPPSPLGGLYLPEPEAPRPVEGGGVTASWATGIYIFHAHSSGGYERWFGADIRTF